MGCAAFGQTVTHPRPSTVVLVLEACSMDGDGAGIVMGLSLGQSDTPVFKKRRNSGGMMKRARNRR